MPRERLHLSDKLSYEIALKLSWELYNQEIAPKFIDETF